MHKKAIVLIKARVSKALKGSGPMNILPLQYFSF